MWSVREIRRGARMFIASSCGAVGQPSISGSDGISVERWKAWSGDPIVDPRTTEASDGS